MTTLARARRSSNIVRLGLVLAALSLATCEARDPDWVPLFNGNDLSGWRVKIAGHELGDNFANTFRVEDGLLKVSYDGYETFQGEFGHLFYEGKLSRYRLRLEYRFRGDQAPGGPEWAWRNSGVMFHAQSAESMGRDQEFPVSIEAQFLGGADEGERPTMNLCTPGTHVVMVGRLVTEHCIDSASKTYRGDAWVTVELLVQGGETVEHFVDGRPVLRYEKPQIGGEYLPEGFPLAEGESLSSGYIALQAESHPIEFRKIELLDLTRD